jgi:hypothetical protein
MIKHNEMVVANGQNHQDDNECVVAVTQHKILCCIGCGDTAFSTVSSSGRTPQRFSRQFYDIVVILFFIS